MFCSPRARARLETGGGWRRTCVGRELRWPSFTTWRWDGPALAGWIRCQRRTRQPPLQPRRRLHTTSKTHPPRAAGPLSRVASRPRNRPGNRAAAQPRSPLRGRAPRNPPKRPLRRAPESPPASPPRRAGGVRLERARGKRARGDLRPGRAPKRVGVAGGGSAWVSSASRGGPGQRHN